MDALPILQQHRALRWLLPVGVLVVAGVAASGMLTTSADSAALPRTTPAALLAAVRQPSVNGFSGTVISRLDLGLPELPNVDASGMGDGGDGTSMTSLLSGAHTLQVWYGGFDQQRVALLGATDETDVFRNGRDVWQWSSADRTAEYVRLPDVDASAAAPDPVSTMTPGELARRAIAAVNPSTRVTVGAAETVADRSAYELVLTPRATTTKIGSVHIAVDGATKVPLGVQVYAKHAGSPAIDISFTNIKFGEQAERNFQFTPPPDAKVSRRAVHPHAPAPGSTAHPQPRVTGSDWTTVVALRPGKAAVAKFGAGILQHATTRVTGSWGAGRLLDSGLVSVLVTDDGRVFAGPVDATDLYSAARR